MGLSCAASGGPLAAHDDPLPAAGCDRVAAYRREANGRQRTAPAAGLVRRRPHPADRRYVVLELSANAMQRAPAGLGAYHLAIADLVAGITAEHAEIIGSFLGAAAHAATRAADAMATES
jgi:hypothetical protein